VQVAAEKVLVHGPRIVQSIRLVSRTVRRLLAMRSRLGVRYDDSDHSYMGDGGSHGHRLRSLIAEKLDARGIALEASAFHRAGNDWAARGGIRPMISGFALPTSAARSTVGTLADPTRPRKAVKRPGYTGFAPTAPEVTN